MISSPSRSTEVTGLPAPTGPYAWTVGFGDLIFVSGLRGIDTGTGRPVDGEEDKVRVIFEHLRDVLASHGCSSHDVLATRVYVTDMASSRPIVNNAFTDFFGEDLPTRTIVEVQALNEGDTVEIEAVVGRPDARVDSL